MRITPDTNVLVRALLEDDEVQAAVAIETLASADSIAISLQSLCELAWVLGRTYKMSRADIAEAIGRFAETRNVVVDRPAVDAGLAMLAAGGDFADGVIAYEGRWQGGETFVSFDKKAVELLTGCGKTARVLG